MFTFIRRLCFMLLATLFSLHHNILSIVPAVAFARLFFPAEAKVAMQIAQADTTEEFGGIVAVAASTSGKLREVDLNETPVTQNKRLRSRVDALMKTGESFNHQPFPL
jgi:regulatory protein NPR1